MSKTPIQDYITKLPNTVLREILSKKTTIDRLSPVQLMDLAKEIYEHRVFSLLKAFKGSMRPTKLMVDKYNRLMKESKEQAEAYAEEKKGSVYNILARTYLPNFFKALEYEEQGKEDSIKSFFD